MQKKTIYPVIMCGGSGTRLWPMSLKKAPKQYHSLISDKTMLQETILRMSNTGSYKVAPPSFICSKDHEAIVYEQSRKIGIEPLFVILEPMGRNTAPATAIAAQIIGGHDPNSVVLLLPADHYIEDVKELWTCISHGTAAASDGKLVTLGLQPTSPKTGYGYIRKGAPLTKSLYMVDKFVEKPELETAKNYLESGDYFWNAGIFLFSPTAMIKSFQTYAPKILAVCVKTLSESPRKKGSIYLNKNTFSNCPSDSLDYAIMEHAENIVLIAPVNVGWDDIGSWQALDEFEKSNTDNPHVTQGENVEIGNTLLLDCENNYVRSDGPLIAGVGLENLTIIATKDAVLILPKSRDQDVKDIVTRLKEDGLKEFL